MALGDGTGLGSGASSADHLAAALRLLTLVNDTITVLDADARIRWINHDSNDGILGYPRRALVGTSPWDYVHPDDVAPLEALWEQLLERPGVSAEAQARLRAADGSYQHVEGNAYNFFDVPGVEGVVLVTRNITDRVEATRADDRAPADLIDQASDLAIVLDPSLNATFVSGSTHETFGLQPGDIRGVDDLVAMITEFDRDHFADALEAAHVSYDHRVEVCFEFASSYRKFALRIRPRDTGDGVGIAITGTELTGPR